jgi:uncharacterized membrane protein YfhO
VRLSLLTGAGFFVLVTALIHLRHKHLLGPTWLVATLLLVGAADLWSFSNPMVRTTNLDLSTTKLGLLESPRADREICRIITMDNLFLPNDGLLYGYQDIQGYDPLILKRYLEYINKSQNMDMAPEAVNVQYIKQLDNPLLRMLNLKYSIQDDTRLFKLEHYQPRAFIVHKARTLPSQQVLDFMMSHNFDLEEVVIFEEGEQTEAFFQQNTATTGNDLNFKATEGNPDTISEHCRIVHYGSDEIALTVSMNDAGYLVLSELNYPGWKAYVNGKKVSILTGNYIFRVLPLPKGDHDILLKFDPDSFKIGLIISVGSILFFLLFQFSVFVRKKR